MCGIAGFYLKNGARPGVNLERLTDALLLSIDSRGGDATGFAAFGDAGCLLLEKATCDALEFIKGRAALPASTRVVMMHTRFATQGHEAFPKNNHPVVSGDVFVTHNGHIMNDYTLWGQIGWENRQADVDSEVIAGNIAAKGWESIGKALSELEGGMAIAAMHDKYPNHLVLAKGDASPLFYLETKDYLVWASTSEALIKAWAATLGTPPKKRIKFLSPGDIMHVKDGEVSFEDFEVAFSYRTTYINTSGRIDAQACGVGNYASKETKALTTSSGDKITAKTLESWGWTDAEINEYATLLGQELDELRGQVDEIIEKDASKLNKDNPILLKEFNARWDRIREIRGELEDLAWSAYEKVEHIFDDEDMAWDAYDRVSFKEEKSVITLIQCPSCYESYAYDEMTPGPNNSLYCDECWDFWCKATDTSKGGHYA